MPAKLIKNFGGLMLEVEVVEWSEHLFHAAYTIDGNYAVTLKCIRTKDYPEGEITVSAAPLLIPWLNRKKVSFNWSVAPRLVTVMVPVPLLVKPPETETKLLSVTNCLINRDRDAPNMPRTAISLRRAAVHTRNIPIRLILAINRTHRTAPNAIISAERNRPTTWRSSRARVTLPPGDDLPSSTRCL